MNNISLSYTQFKSIISAKGLLIQYLELDLDSGKSYDLFAYDGPVKYESTINSQEDITDFETSYKTNANKPLETPHDSLGIPRSSLYFPALGMIPCWRGFQFTPTINSTTFYDVEVWNYIRMASGIAWVSNVEANNWADYIEFSIVDKNDILGYFQYYGMTVGTHVLEIKKFVKTEYVRKNDASDDHIVNLTLPSVMADPVPQGLFLRTSYFCASTTIAPKVVVRYHYYEE